MAGSSIVCEQFCPETPDSANFLRNKCDTCGKSFLYSSSYRRHLKTPCTTRKRRRRLWLADENDIDVVEDYDVGVTTLLDASASETTSESGLTEGFDDVNCLNQDSGGEESTGNDEPKTFQEISESEPEDNPNPESPEDTDVENDESSLHWSEEDIRGLMQDLNEPLQEPPPQQPMLNRVNLLLRWLCCFILYWQVVTRVSDAATEWLLSFLGKFFEILSGGLESEFFKNLILFFPSTVYMLHGISSLKRDEFEKFVVCGKCAKLYHLDECLERKHGTVLPKRCTNILFPLGKAKHCGNKLVNKVILKNGATKFYPLKVYCWKSVISQLESILQRTGMPELCEQWRTREANDDVLSDVYDGDIWKTFKWKDGSHFFSMDRRYGLMLNVDWFQPFKRQSDYSVGVIYFVIMNLPRSERFKFENVILGQLYLYI